MKRQLKLEELFTGRRVCIITSPRMEIQDGVVVGPARPVPVWARYPISTYSCLRKAPWDMELNARRKIGRKELFPADAFELGEPNPTCIGTLIEAVIETADDIIQIPKWTLGTMYFVFSTRYAAEKYLAKVGKRNPFWRRDWAHDNRNVMPVFP